ncbi:MAG: L-lactate permease [Acidobacteria bacterium]|nr:MAG: L-lactate permease [Acidobacteriota bacterium]
MFQQSLVLAGSLGITILLSLVPLIVLLFLLAGIRMTAWLATLITGVITIPLGVFLWQAPFRPTMQAYWYGSLTGVWVIDWITFWGLIIFNTLVVTGDFDTFQKWMLHHATADVRIQTLMLAWAFGALLEGVVGFGYPWAVVAPILITLGIADLEALRVAALANNAPVSFGALGSPILALSAVTSLPLLSLSASVGHIVAVLALFPTWVLLYLVSGWVGLVEAWPLAIVASLAYIAGQWPVARYWGPYLPDISGSLVSFWALYAFVKVWKPKTIRGFGGAPLTQTPAVVTANPDAKIGALRAWLPYIILLVVVGIWTGPWLPKYFHVNLPGLSLHKWSVSAISSVTHKAAASTFNFTPLSGGTSILVSWLVILLFLRPTGAQLQEVFRKTFRQMWGALLVGFFIFGLAYTFVFTGMANSLAFGLSKIGPAFVILCPVLGWIGVALSGSNTSTNAMFGPVQATAGGLLKMPALLLPSLNSVGAEVGKPVAPQTASVGVSTTRFVRSEGEVIRHNMSWTFVMLGYLVLVGLLFYFFFPNLMQL